MQPPVQRSHAARLLAAAAIVHLACLAVGPRRFTEVVVGISTISPTWGELAWGLALLAVVPLLLGTNLPLPGPRNGPIGRNERLVWSAIPLLGALFIGAALTGWETFTTDEDVYLLQARLLLDGAVSEPAPEPAAAVSYGLYVPALSPDGSSWWAGCYPLAAGVLTLPGLLVGFPSLMWLLLPALLVWNGSKLCEEWFPSADARLATALLAASPQLAALGTVKHTAVPCALLAVVLVRLALRLRTQPLAAVAWGAAFGALVHTRPVESGIVALVTGLFAVLHLRELPAPQWLRLALGAAIGGAPMLALWLAYNRAVTGHALTMPYALVPDAYGFGIPTFFGPHDPLIGSYLVGLAWLRSWIYGLGPWVLPIGLLTAARGARSDARLGALLLAAALHFALYVPAPYGSVPTGGPAYQTFLLPIGALLAGVAAGQLASRARLLRALWWLGVLAVWPWVAWSTGAITRGMHAPDHLVERVAEGGPVLVVFERWRPTWRFAGMILQPPVLDEEIAYVSASRPDLVELVHRTPPERRVFQLRWEDGQPRLLPIDVAAP